MAKMKRGKSLDDISKQNLRLVQGLNDQLLQAYRNGDNERAEEIKGRITRVQYKTNEYNYRINNQKTVKNGNEAVERTFPNRVENEKAYYDAIDEKVKNRHKKYSTRTYMGSSVG